MAGANPQMLIRIAANLQELRKNLAEGKAQIETTTAAMTKLASSLQGDRLIQQAHNITAAVQHIGGVAKLTTAEKDRMNATLSKALEKYQLLGREAPPAMIALANATAKVPPQLSLLERGASIVKSSFVQMFGAFTAAGIVTMGLQKLASGIGEFIGVGMKLPAVQQSFAQLSRGLGQDSRTMLVNLQTATKGLVANYDLMASANKAMMLGLPVTAASMGELAKTARVLGKAMGQDATKSLDDLITALGRSSPMILDNLGLTVKVGEANEKYAQKLGKTVDQLTEAEKKTAFYEAALEAARRRTAQLGDQTKTLGEIAETAWVKFGNVVSDAAATVNVGVGRILKDWQSLKTFALTAAVTGVPKALEIAKLTAELEQRGRDVLLSDPNAEARAAAAERAKKIAEDAKKAAEAWAKSVRDLTHELSGAKLQGEVRRLQQAVDALTPAQLKEAETLKRLGETARNLHDEGATLTPQLHQIYLKTTTLIPVTNGLSQEFEKVGKSIKMAYDSSVPWIGMLNGLQSLPGTLMPKSVAPEGNVWSKLLGVQAGERHPLFAEAQRLGFGAADSIANAIVSGDWKGMLKDLGNKFAAAAGSAIAAGVNVLVPGLGTLLEPIFTALTQKLGKLFTREGRDLVKRFAADQGGFDALREKLNALGDEGERLWIRLTQGIDQNSPAQAKAAIDAITAALEANKKKADEAGLAQIEMHQKAVDKAKAVLDALESEIASIQKSIENEAPEEVMGVIEAQARARLEALKKERDAAAQHVLEVQDQLTQSLDRVAAAIERIPHDIEIRVRTQIDGDRVAGPYPQAHGGDYWVTKPTLFLAGEAGPERATFSGGGGSGRETAVGDVYVYIGNEQINAHIDRVARRQLATGTWRPRVAAGRSY